MVDNVLGVSVAEARCFHAYTAAPGGHLRPPALTGLASVLNLV
jgi:hypothetical protein